MSSAQEHSEEMAFGFDPFGSLPLDPGFDDLPGGIQDEFDSGIASPASSASGGVLLSETFDDEVPAASTTKPREPSVTLPSKIGSRFTSGAIKVLRTWFDNHERHPYPTPKDIDRLQNQTGLERQQITNWFANTRRRRKFRSYAASSAQVPSWTETTTGAVEIPTRRPTPMPLELMNPMQRWEHSPPEHEPALCTFCTETFRTKYDWQRHEKSLHLSLEEWVCCPNGATEEHPEKGEICVYCEEPGPSKSHVDEHNHAACSERPFQDRTFYRKDHLRQHLKLVHGSKQMTPLMEKWKTTKSKIRSRCGFCDAKFETWADRGDHLADHFKNGSTVGDWKGDWGFEPSVLEILDKAMPPYLIQFELCGPVPFTASVGPADTASSAYELLKLEVEYYVRNYYENRDSLPSDDELIHEGCSIIFGAEFVSSAATSSPSPSWLRDVFMSSTEITARARLRPMNQLLDIRLSQLKINGKSDIFEGCQLESQLCRHVGLHDGIGLPLSDKEIQQEACAILRRVDEFSGNPSSRSTQSSYEDIAGEPPIGLSENSPSELMSFFNGDMQGLKKMGFEADGVPPFLDSNGALQTTTSHKTSLQTPAIFSTQGSPEATEDLYLRQQMAQTLFAGSGQSLQEYERPRGNGMPFFLNDHNRYLHLARELSRFVKSTMSPNNPNCHVPTDEEIKHQARWIIYDE
ncbi:hypothetical protein CkaCkLH20_01747 [Colletotrichum karsti]|uniref:Homeobox domain-containing protein n=1 Tax=Colletotrichum karsti TaxID=1095194 RepID=A0A9P6IJ03_9PEZI|nr:uncharacterized protein CkaCkLH20_01747 [Colletotrichum karsti]KAF9880705.1 hypothetical protein CkaCkLH20_01747 [Colletotrichum karsti]